jgi:WD40 repeat protein
MARGSRTFRVFVSSTFGDLKRERNVLQREVFPPLRSLCVARNFRFQAIDLRWGVSEEAALDQRAMTICLDEIARCQRVTPRPNFLILLGDRYGWRPLPAEIPVADFERVRQAIARPGPGRDRSISLLDAWYRRDDNALDVVYTLQPRRVDLPEGAPAAAVEKARSDEKRGWERVERRLSRLLRAGAARAGFPPGHPLRRLPSATEQEIVRGALETPDAEQHVFAFLRRIVGSPPAPLPSEETGVYVESDREARVRQLYLKRTLRRRLGGNVESYEVGWSPSGIEETHLERLVEDILDRLRPILESEMDRFEAEDPQAVERRIHDEHAEVLREGFVGRGAELERIARYLGTRPGHLLAVTGGEGTGKSALLAEAAALASERDPGAVVRFFLGISPRSTDPRTLLEDVGRALAVRFDVPFEPPDDFRGLAQEFARLMALATASRPLLLFLDALDQISRAESAHHLAWLPSRLPGHVAIVVSSLPGDPLRALEAKRPPVELVPVPPLSAEEAEEIVDATLVGAGRRLQPAQREEVLRKARLCPRPLYLRLVLSAASRWRSYDPVAVLEDSIDALVRGYVGELSRETHHGGVIVSRGLGYLAAAKRGLTEDELIDLLSRDEEVLEDFERRSRYGHELPDRRLPVVVWSRLFFDLQTFLNIRRADGADLIGFYHGSLGRVARELFVGPSSELLHGRMAEYFGRQSDRLAARRINVRRASELAFHQLHAGRWEDLRGTIGDIAFLDIKAAAGLVYDTVDDFELARETLLADGSEDAPPADLRELVLAMSRAYNQEFHTFLARPVAGQQLYNNLFAAEGASAATAAALHRFAKLGPFAPAAWLRRGNRAPETSTARALERTIKAHAGRVRALAVSPSGSRIATGGVDGQVRVWRERDGGLVAAIHAHDGEVAGLAWLPAEDGETLLASAEAGGRVRIWNWRSEEERTTWDAGHRVRALAVDAATGLLVTGGEDRTVRAFDPETGQPRCLLRGHEDRVFCLAAVPGGGVASGGEDRTLRLWSLEPCAERGVLRGSEDAVRGIAVDRESGRLLSTGDDRRVRLWRMEGGRGTMERAVTCGHGGALHCVGVCRSEGSAPVWIAGGADGALRVWEGDSGAERPALRGHSGAVNALEPDPRGRWVASVGEDGTLRVWEGSGLLGRARAGSEHGAGVLALAVTAGGDIASASEDSTLKLWGGADGELGRTLRGHLGAATCVVGLPGGGLASGGADRTLRTWDLERGVPERTFGSPVDVKGDAEGGLPPSLGGAVCHRHPLTCLATAGTRWLISASRDGSVWVWDHAVLAPDRELRGASGVVEGLVVWRDGRRILAWGTAREIFAWSLDPNRERQGSAQRLAGHRGRVGCAGLAGEAGLLATGGFDGAVRLWDLETLAGREVGRVDGWILSVAIDPRGRFLVTGGKDGRILLWDPERGKVETELAPHGKAVGGLTLDPTGRRLASHGEDGWIRVHDLEAGDREAAAHFDGPIRCLAWRDPDHLVFGTRWGGVGVLRVETARGGE